MFDTLTQDERRELHEKLFNGGRKFAQVSHALAGTAQDMRARGSDDSIVWAERCRFSDAMNESYELMRLAA